MKKILLGVFAIVIAVLSVSAMQEAMDEKKSIKKWLCTIGGIFLYCLSTMSMFE